MATAIPSGHELDVATPGKTITTDLSASRNDQSFVDLSSPDVTVTYTSANPPWPAWTPTAWSPRWPAA